MKGAGFGLNLYHALNEMITYIEQNLEQDISYTKLARLFRCQ